MQGDHASVHDAFELALPTPEEEDLLSKEVEERVRKWLRELPDFSVEGEAVAVGKESSAGKPKFVFPQNLSFVSRASTDKKSEREQSVSNQERTAPGCFAGIVHFLRK